MSNVRGTTAKSAISRVLELALQLALAMMFGMVVLLVILRYLFHTTIIGGNEATAVAFVFSTALGAALALGRDEHISIRYFSDQMAPRAGEILAAIRWLLLAAFNIVLVYYSVVWIQRTGGFLMPAMGVPQIVAQISVPIGCSLSVFYCLRELRRLLANDADD